MVSDSGSQTTDYNVYDSLVSRIGSIEMMDYYEKEKGLVVLGDQTWWCGSFISNLCSDPTSTLDMMQGGK